MFLVVFLNSYSYILWLFLSFGGMPPLTMLKDDIQVLMTNVVEVIAPSKYPFNL